MRKHLSFMIAASLATGTFLMAQEQKPDPTLDERTPAKKAEDLVDRAAERVERAVDKAEKSAEAKPFALPPGVTPKDLKEEGDVRNAFEAITEGSMSKDIFDNIVNRLVDADRNRISKYKDTNPDWKPLTDRVATLERSWKEKYGKKFDLDEKVVFGANNYVVVAQGEISDPKALMGNWPVQPNVNAVLAAAKKPAVNTAEQANDANKAAGGDTNLDKGRNVAVARYPAGHGLPAVDASLIHELPDIWRFDLPDNIDGQKLTANLIAHLNQVGTKGWPDDINEAYRIVAHRVLLAMYDVPVEPADAARN